MEYTSKMQFLVLSRKLLIFYFSVFSAASHSPLPAAQFYSREQRRRIGLHTLTIILPQKERVRFQSGRDSGGESLTCQIYTSRLRTRAPWRARSPSVHP